MMDPNWNRFRFDVDDSMAGAQEQLAQSEQDRQRAKRVWDRIRNELDKDGPMAQLLAQFREDAVRAMGELIYVETSDAGVRALQADVQRSLRTMEHIDTFQNAAEVADANAQSEIDSDEQPLTESED
jgi:hypothetical protein